MKYTLPLLLALAATALAEDDPVRDAWAKLKTATEQGRKDLENVSPKFKDAKTPEEKAAAQKAWREAYGKNEATLAPLQKTFRESFDKADWGAFDPKADAELLEEGLTSVAQEAVESDPKRALEAWELLLAKLPECSSARWVRSTWMPIGLLSAGDLEHAEKRLAALCDSGPDESKPDLKMAIGDARAMKGDYAGAQAAYAEGLKLIPEGADPMKDARGRAKGYLELRAKLIGQPAPEIDSKTWFGADAKPLSALKGRVVLLEFWATW
ncbi:MAG: hypothetical protein HYY18_19850 [Planctomycetes bacterium]|nr:hypothetical protein [Planctomycetota bacterium]